MHAVLSAIQARSSAEFDAVRAEATNELQDIFGDDAWGVRLSAITYTEENVHNLWRNEIRPAIRRQLEAQGRTEHDYRAWLAEIHYTQAVIYRSSLFGPESYKDNQGWRILLLSVPAVQGVAVGIASHYQGGQAHNKLAAASHCLFDIAEGGLERQGYAMPGRKVAVADWDRTGILSAPTFDVCDVDIRQVSDGAGLWLKDVRTTTVKKTIASYISLEPVVPIDSEDIEHLLLAYREAAQILV